MESLSQFTLVFILMILCLNVYSIRLDSYDANRNIKKLAFGSCSKIKYPLHYLQSLLDIEPDIWLWTGDTVYGPTKHGTDLATIRDHYQRLKSHSLYQRFVATNLFIDGVYDDHDIGMNDADNRLSNSIQTEAQHMFLDFLDIDESSPRRTRDGVYSVHKYGDVMIILLDTRTHRSPTVIPSIGKYEYPLTAMIASYLRYCTGSLSSIHNYNYNGTVLGPQQWKWFEDILQSTHFKTSELVLIVSSTQIFTSNPYFESWGHFPLEKLRLLRLMDEYIGDEADAAPHVLFISGDVHHSELIYGNEAYGPLEVTSSGLTHSLSTMAKLFGLQRWLALHIVERYQVNHRTKYLKQNIQNGYYERNFGVIEIINENEYRLSIHDAISGDKVISVPLNNKKESSFKQVLKELNAYEMDHLYFPLKYPFYGLEIIGPITLLLCICIIIRIAVKNACRKNNDTKSKRNKEL